MFEFLPGVVIAGALLITTGTALAQTPREERLNTLVALCVPCHGGQGSSPLPDNPALSGQHNPICWPA